MPKPHQSKTDQGDILIVDDEADVGHAHGASVGRAGESARAAS